MTLSARDAQVIDLVGRFSQLSSSHLKTLSFENLAPTTLDRCLARLLKSGYPLRVGRRSQGAILGASPFVYQLGAKGWAHCGIQGAFQKSSVVNEHSLRVADVHASIIQAERSAILKPLGFELGVEIGGVRPDAWLEIGVVGQGRKVAYYLEVDLSTESPTVIEAKCNAYLQVAYEAPEGTVWPWCCL